jgi:hypothetical protein
MNIFVASVDATSWRTGLADPVKHWKTGFSAKALATCWEANEGFPPSVQQMFEASSYPLFHGAEMLLGIPEHRVPLAGGSRPSQTDLFVLARSMDELIAITVEGKVSEPFDSIVSEWLEKGGVVVDDVVTSTPGKIARLAYLCEQLGLTADEAEPLRYQLLHRTVSALIEARRFTARHALMLVHSFNQDGLWFDDYARFAHALGVDEAAPDRIERVGMRGGVDLYLGWCKGEAVYLTDPTETRQAGTPARDSL